MTSIQRIFSDFNQTFSFFDHFPYHFDHFRCLVFGTDGLWNVVSPQGAIDNVRHSDQMNERSACMEESKEWMNPSKNLVDKALERWSTKKMRADNTSVVIIMFDPPGPPKREILKSSASKQSQLLGYLPSESDDQPSQHLEIEPVQNFAMFDHSTNELMDIDGIPLPTSGATVLTKYENIAEADVQRHNQQETYAGPSDEENGNEGTYMNSFAESYNSLLNSSLNEDHSYVYNNEANEDDDFDDSSSYDNPNTTHQYMERPHEPTYSLHKLKTRSEQEYDAYASTSSSPMPSTSHSMYGDYQHNLVDHNYLGNPSVYPSTSSGYLGREMNGNEEIDPTLLTLSSSEYLFQRITLINPKDMTLIGQFSSKESQYVPKECIASTSKGYTGSELNSDDMDDSRDSNIDDSIQINEISSSNNNNSSIHGVAPRPRKPSSNMKRSNEAVEPPSSERKVTRSSSASVARITRSAGVEKRSVARSLKTKVAVIMQKQSTSNATTGRNHKENISILRKLPVKALVDSAIVTPSRVRNSGIPQPDNKLLNQRTLRSQNALTKETVNKAVHRSASSQTADVNTIIQQIGRVVAHAKANPVSTRANSNIKINAATTVKSLVCKKPPKRLINAQSVQIVKSNNNNKWQKSSVSLPQAVARTSTLRFKVVVAKKSVVEQLRNGARPSVITRRMRLQQ